MAKKTENKKDLLFQDEKLYTPVEESSVSDQIQNSMIDYGSYIIEKRAIPSALDGLKPSQRRSIYTFKHLNVVGRNVKLARISGTCIAEFHPHGDASINDAISNMVQPWKNNFQFFKGQGNWGSIAGDNPAAARYIEVMLNKESEELLFENINKGKSVVPWEMNYDDRIEEPILFPVKYPLHLINGTSGIAYAMSTSIPSFNIKEISKTFIYLIENKFWDSSWKTEDHKQSLLSIIKGPDLPTGCDVYFPDKTNLEDYLFNSQFSFKMRTKYELFEKDLKIVFSNIPFNVSTEKIKEEILSLSLDYRIEKKLNKEIKIPKEDNEILNLKASSPIIVEIDENHQENATLTLFFKSGSNLNTELVKLLTNTSLDKTFSSNILVINEKGVPETISIYKNIRLFLYFRRHVIYQSFLYEIQKLKEQKHLLEGLIIVLNEKEKFLKIVTESDEVKRDLLSYFKSLSEIQVDYILDMKINRLTKSSIENIKEDIKSKESVIQEKEEVISSSEKIFEYIKKDYEGLLQNNKSIRTRSRKSRILKDVSKISMEDTIDNEEIILMLMNDETIGYVEKSKFEARNRGRKLKNTKINQSNFDINVKTVYDGKLKDECFFVTNKGRIFKEVLWKFSKKFLNIRNFFNLDSEEDVIKIVTANQDFINTQNIMLITSQMVKNIPLKLFKNVTARSGKIAQKLKEGDEVTNVLIHNNNDEEYIVLITKEGKIMKFNKEEIKEIKSGTSIGTRIINKKAEVLQAFLIPKNIEDNSIILLASDIGKGKKVKLSEITVKKIKQSPVNVFENNSKNGNLIGGVLLDSTKNNEEIVLISDTGGLSIIKVKNDLKTVSRSAKGSFLLINNEENEKIIFVTKNETSDEETN